MSELNTWEDGELIGLLRSEIQYVEDFTDTGRLDDVVEEIEKRLNQSSDKIEDYLRVYSKEAIEIIKAKKKQLVTSDEFYGLHQEKLAAERNSEHLKKRDLAILTAYTGVMFGDFQDFHGYAEEILGHPIFTHQFGDKQMSEKLHELSKEDFLQLHEKLIRESETVND